ncbi:hypothetical protein ACFX2I_000045 [Malus domestica]
MLEPSTASSHAAHGPATPSHVPDPHAPAPALSCSPCSHVQHTHLSAGPISAGHCVRPLACHAVSCTITQRAPTCSFFQAVWA